MAETCPRPRIAASVPEYQRFQTGAQPLWTPLRLPGQYHDAETDLFENWNRYYDPSIGRYLQPEPLQAVDPTMAMEPAYSYGKSDPLKNADPTGLYTLDPASMECPNFPRALSLLNKKLGCDGNPSPEACECHAGLECNICPMLQPGTFPNLLFTSIPGTSGFGRTRYRYSYPYGNVRAKPHIYVRGVEIKPDLCHRDHPTTIESLAYVILHEFNHACAEQTQSLSWDPFNGVGPKKCLGRFNFWDYLSRGD